MLSASFKGNLQLQRIIYLAFGASLVEGLEVFSAFFVSYCIIRRDSCIFSELMQRQELELACFRVELMSKKM